MRLNWSGQSKPMHDEHANSTQKGPRRDKQDCEARVVTTTLPLLSHLFFFFVRTVSVLQIKSKFLFIEFYQIVKPLGLKLCLVWVI